MSDIRVIFGFYILTAIYMKSILMLCGLARIEQKVRRRNLGNNAFR
jgi:hypothetical protein